jgi:hypothetical protein
MSRAIGMCAAIASMAACGFSDTYGLPTGGFYATGGNGAGTVGGNTGTTGSASGGNTGVVGSVGVNGTTNGLQGTSAGIGNGPGGATASGTGTGGMGVGTATAGNGPGTGSGTGGNGTTGGVGTTGGTCATQLQPCGPNTACCPNLSLSCENEPSAGSSFCEVVNCKTDAQCTNAETICSGGNCVLNICGGKSGNGDYNSTCTSGSDDGTCVPKGSGKEEYGICYAAGSSDGGCSDSALTTDPTQLCVAGQACLPNPNGPSDLCRTVCDPGFGGSGKDVCQDAGYSGGCFAIDSLGVCFNF